MQADAQRYRPFTEHFVLHVVRDFHSREAAEALEQQLIQQYNTRDPAMGYNTLPGTPGSSEVFWMQHRRRQRTIKA
jgi:hypothetical protein